MYILLYDVLKVQHKFTWYLIWEKNEIIELYVEIDETLSF